MSILDRISGPADIRGFSNEELETLAADIRARLIDVCSRTGGHIGAGLGVVELSIALHYVFNTPKDQLVWDVGHQGYPHKVLTGRNAALETLRQEQGLSGFLKRTESEYDSFGAGHAATSISAALGIAAGRDLVGDDYEVVAILGDGALTSGLAYEGLNNAGHSDRDMIVVLNDNEMSIAPNVGAMSKYLNSIQRNSLYNRLRNVIGELTDRAPGPVPQIVRKWEESVKAFLTEGVLFEELGFRYFGPIDGHDFKTLIETFKAVKGLKGPRLVHVITQKGKGFPAGEHVEKWHALPPGHDPSTGKQRTPVPAGRPNYTKVFGRGLAELGVLDSRVATITAAMPSGTGTEEFAKSHPKRFFDVGIAEGHAVTFAAGMATRGIKPFVAIYSTFLQRGYDNIVHDVAIQSLPVTFCMDRAGLVGEDGETHMGLYDIAYMLAVPGMTVTAPKDSTEMLALMKAAASHSEGPFCLRYPRDTAPDDAPPMKDVVAPRHASWDVVRRGKDFAILAVGTMVLLALAAADELAKEGIDVTVVNCRYLKPFDELTLDAILAGHRMILTAEEGTMINGFGAYMASVIARREAGVRVSVLGVPDRIIHAASRKKQLAECGLDAAGIASRVRALLESEALARVIRLGVVGHSGYDGLTTILATLTEAAARFGIEPYFEKDLLPFVAGGKALEKPASIDALLTLGGDGTLLRGARLIASHQVPILGVNMGRLGFLTCCGADQFVEALDHLARKEYKVEQRMGLVASIDRPSGAVRESWIALNDVVVHKGGVARIASLKVGVSGEPVATYSADGVVISTPTGLTAYSLSAGGPVVFPTLESILVTPVSPHTLAIRPLLLPAESEVTVQRDDGPSDILVTVDGQVGSTLGLDETLRVHRAGRPILIIRFPGLSFFATLRKKLGWGGLPERDEPTS